MADADVRAVAAAGALAYAGIFPPGENGLAPLQDDDDDEDEYDDAGDRWSVR